MRTFSSYVALSLFAVLAFAGPAAATSIVFTTQASFLAAIANPDVDMYNDLPFNTLVGSPLARSTVGALYTYTASAPSNFFPAGSAGDPWLSTNEALEPITLTNFSAGVRAIGGFFFATDRDGNFLANQGVIVTLTDANSTSPQPLLLTTTTTFLGFLSDSPLTSLTISGIQDPGLPVWPTVNDLTLGTAAAADSAVPEPASMVLLGTGLAAASARRWRRRRS